MASVVIPWSPPTRAATIVPFAARFTTNDNGAIAVFGNNVLTCPATNANCAGARNGTATGAAANNNAYNMVNLDTDDVAATFNSSNSQVILPDGATVLFAGLYWGARRTGGTGGTTTTAPLDQMSLRLPGEATYRTIASQRQFGPSGDNAYQQFANVTALVGGAGPGTYWGANVAAGTGQDRYGGWSLVVVYRDPTQPLRNLTVFDGFSEVAVNSSETITISGFLAPPSGAVDARLGMVAYEGDRGSTGDFALLNETRLGTELSTGSNFFNGSNDRDGQSVVARDPSDVNMLGYDIKQLGVPGAIPNDATSATIMTSTTSERYSIGVVTTAIAIYAPDFTPSRKAVTNLAGRDPAGPGDTLEYTLTYTNSGQDAATGSVATDVLPPNTTFVPGSIEVLTGPNAGVKTDGVDGDQAEFLAATRTVRVRLGTGATGSAGGIIGPGATTSVRFRVTVDTAAAGTTLLNHAELDYVADTLNSPFTFIGNETATPVAENADLVITKTTSPDPTLAGADVTSTITVTNNGPNTAVGVVVTDTLSDDVAPISATPSVGTCGILGQGVSCGIGSLANGASATVTVVGRAPPSSVVTSFTNLAAVSSATIDPDSSNNTVGATVEVARRADLAITKGATPSTATPGTQVSFPITVTNLGPSDAVDVRVSDVLDSRLTLVSATPPCVPSGGANVSCTFGTLTPGASATATITAVVDPSLPAGTAIPNTATSSSLTPDLVTGNDSATSTVTTGPPEANLAITKVGSAASVVAGGQVSYTITVINNGPSNTADATVTDALPTGGTVANVSSSRGTCTTAAGVVCELGPLPVGGTATITLVADYGPDTPLGAAPNTATIASTTADPTPGDNSSTVPLTVTGVADLSITKTGTPNPVVAGQPVIFTVTVTNEGPSRARGVVVQDTLPPEFVFVSAVPTQGSCGAPTGGIVACTLGELADDAQAQIDITMNVPAGFPDGGAATNQAAVTSTTTDPDPSDDTAEFTTTGDAAADLSATKVETPDPAVAGGPVTWTITVTNNGPSTASDVTLVDDLPVGLTGVTAAGCTVSATQVSCPVGALAPGLTATFTIDATVLPGGEAGDRLINIATVSSSTDDPTASNNVATTNTAVVSQTDLAVTKFTTPEPAPVGSPVFFVITVNNNGPSTARNVTFVDTFDGDAALVTETPGCQLLAGGELECALPDLAPGAPPAQFAFGVLILDDPGAYTNRVQVSSSTPETNTANNVAEVPVTATPPEVDLVLTKAGPPELLAGGRFEYTLTLENVGESVAFPATVTDTLPTGLIPDTAQGEGVQCEIVGQTVTCTAEFVLTPDFGAPPLQITIVGNVLPGIIGTTATNTATATAEGEINPADNTASTTTPIVRQSNVSVTKQADSAEFVAGGTVSYTVTVTNAGPSSAPNAVLTDILPDDVVFDPVISDPRCAAPIPPSTDVICDLTTVPAGETVVLRVGGRLDPNHLATTLTNTAVFTSDSDDPNPDDDTVTIDTPVGFSADLAATKTAVSETVTAGGQVEFILTITNEGPSTARGVEFVDTVPAGLSLVSITPTPSVPCVGATCTVGDLEPGASVSAVVVVAVPPSHPPGPILNTVTASSPTPDPNPARRTATAESRVLLVADLSVVKTVVTDPVVAGQPVTYQITVANQGPSDAINATFVDPFPAGTVLVGGTPPVGATCEVSNIEELPTVSCELARLPAGASISGTLTLATAFSLTGGLTNAASVGSDALDPVDTDNHSEVTSPIVAADTAVDLVVTKTGPATLEAGGTFAYDLTVANEGVSISTGGTVTDTLPVGLVPTTATIGGAACPIAGQVVTCATGLLRPGAAPVVLRIEGTVDPNIVANTAINTATGTPVGTETDPTDNTASTTATISRVSDLSVTKAAATPNFTAGEQVTYTITVTNAGPAAAPNTVITDTLPTAVTFNPALSDPRCTLSTPPGEVTCTLGTVTAGSPAVVQLVGLLDPAFTGDSIANTASVDSPDSSDPDPSDDSSTIDTPVTHISDLAVTKTAVAPPFTAGTDVAYTITVSNTGPSAAAATILTDTLPTGLTFDPALSDPRCTLTIPPSGITCNLATVSAGGIVTVAIGGLLDPGSTAVSNSASVTSDSTDPDPLDNSTTIDTPVTRVSDLSVTKVASTPFVAGTDVTYTLSVTNAGPSAAAATIITDTLPTGLTFDPTLSDPRCTLTTPPTEVTCALGTVAVGAAVALQVVGRLDANVATGSISNTASVTSDSTDPDLLDNTTTITTPVTLVSNLGVTKAAVAPPFIAGTAVGYTITVTNVGPSAAAATVVTDTLPAGVTFNPALSDARCTLSAPPSGVTCNLATVAVGTVTVAIGGQLAATFTGTSVTNTASVVSTATDPDPLDNTTTIDTPVTRAANLSVTKVADTADFVAGGGVSYTLTVINAGPSAADDVSITDSLPTGVRFDAAGSDSRCTLTTPPSGVTCALGTVPASGSIILDLAGTLDQDVAAGSLSNTATITSSTGDPDGTDNTSTDATPVRRSADLSMTKTIAPATPVAGGPITITLTITNDGPSSANGTFVTDPLDPAIAITTTTASQGTCETPLRAVVGCELGRIPAGGTATVTITGTLSPDFTGGLGNTATVTGVDPDPDPSDNTSSVSVDTDAASDLAVEKELLDELNAGGQSTYRLTITNAGPATARNVVVTDPLNPSLTFVSASAGECTTAADGAVICGLGDVAVGARVTVDLVVDVALGASGSIPNTVSVAAATRDPDTANNTDGVDDPVTQEADLTLTKVAASSTASPGGQSRFTITVTNEGPSVAEDVVAADALPAGMALVSLDPSPDRVCTGTSCVVGDMAPGETFSMVLVASIDASVPNGPLTNTASAASSTPGPTPEPRIVSAAIMIGPPPTTTTTTTDPTTTTTTSTPPTTTIRPSGGGSLPISGSDAGAIAVTAAGLLSLGAIAFVVGRRRRTPDAA